MREVIHYLKWYDIAIGLLLIIVATLFILWTYHTLHISTFHNPPVPVTQATSEHSHPLNIPSGTLSIHSLHNK
jgi:hypothetical protein